MTTPRNEQEQPQAFDKATLNFNDKEYNAEKAGETGHEYSNLDFRSLPKELFASAVREAEGLMAEAQKHNADLSKTAIGQIAAGLDKDHKITKDDLAAALLANSMRTENQSNLDQIEDGAPVPKVSSTFKNLETLDLKPVQTLDLHISAQEAVQSDDPKVVFALAQQILKVSRPEEVPAGSVPAPAETAKILAEHVRVTAR